MHLGRRKQCTQPTMKQPVHGEVCEIQSGCLAASKREEVFLPMPASAKNSAAPFVPQERSLTILRQAVQQCRGCELYRDATQAVFGELETGSKPEKPTAAIMMIGEQPGDLEDKEGRPFVGPAGKFLDKCLAEVGIDRRTVYVTNTVKHFKWEPRGRLRIHKKPNTGEIRACRPWLDAELEMVRPELIVCLGATAAQALLGASFRITQSHGQVQRIQGLPPVLPTLHPAAILRARTEEDRARDTELFVHDLKLVSAFLSH